MCELKLMLGVRHKLLGSRLVGTMCTDGRDGYEERVGAMLGSFSSTIDCVSLRH